jgi:hypothetical protein
MTRILVFLVSLSLAFLTISSASIAQPSDWISFSLSPGHHDSSKIRAEFRYDDRRHDENQWTSDFVPAAFNGLDLAALRAAGTRPIRFAIIREPGRLDCMGQGGDLYAHGNCSFTANPAFGQLLAARGIGQPTREDSIGLMALDVRRDLIDALAEARYPTPRISDLMSLTALGVSRAYIAGLSAAGYRPSTLDALVQFKALDITPDYVGGLIRIGYPNIAPDDLVQLKALGVTPAYIQGFEQLGYRQIPVDTLVQLKALDITPDFVRAVRRDPRDMPPVNDLVGLKIFQQHR